MAAAEAHGVQREQRHAQLSKQPAVPQCEQWDFGETSGIDVCLRPECKEMVH